MQDERFARMAGRMIGQATAMMIVMAFALLITPWVTIGSINRLFDIDIAHNAANYLYFWVITLSVRAPIKITNKE